MRPQANLIPAAYTQRSLAWRHPPAVQKCSLYTSLTTVTMSCSTQLNCFQMHKVQSDWVLQQESSAARASLCVLTSFPAVRGFKLQAPFKVKTQPGRALSQNVQLSRVRHADRQGRCRRCIAASAHNGAGLQGNPLFANNPQFAAAFQQAVQRQGDDVVFSGAPMPPPEEYVGMCMCVCCSLVFLA